MSDHDRRRLERRAIITRIIVPMPMRKPWLAFFASVPYSTGALSTFDTLNHGLGYDWYFERSCVFARISMRVHWIAFAEILLATASAFAYYYWPQFLVLPKPQISQQIREANGCPVISWPGRYLVGKLAGFDEEFSAYLMFDYLRSRESLRGRNVLLTTDRISKGFSYRISAHLPDDVLAGVEELADLRANHLTALVEYSWITPTEFSEDLRQTDLLVQGLQQPGFPKPGADTFR